MSERLGENSGKARDSSSLGSSEAGGMSKHVMYAVQAVAAMFFVGCLLCFVLLVLPFAPLALSGYEGLDTTVCPGATVRAWADEEAASGYPIDNAHISSYWRNTDTGEIIGSSDTSIPLSDMSPGGKMSTPSPVYRIAPERAGSYKLVADVTVNGHILFMPRPQKIHAESDQALTVVSKDSPQCAKEEG